MGAAMIRRMIRFLGSVISGSPDEEDPRPSVVLLLETPVPLTRETALELAARAWGESDSRAAVTQRRGGRWLIRVSDVLFGVGGGRGRYRRPGREASQVRQGDGLRDRPVIQRGITHDEHVRPSRRRARTP